MKEKYIHIFSIAGVVCGLVFITFLYWAEPRSLAEVTSKGQVVLGTYGVDKAEFDRGMTAFRAEDYAGARAAFERADPEKRDAATQYYIAYSYYRQGWGRFSNDDALFAQGITAVDRVIAIDPNYRSADPSLAMKTPTELKTELDEGLKLTPSDLNPFKLTNERK
jgi:hypothetical protein